MEILERWAPVAGWEGKYEVSTRGRVRRIGYGFIGHTMADGYASVILQERRRVHQLVLETFVGPCPPEHEVHHVDNNKQNNRVENLSYVTREDHAKERIGRKHRIPTQEEADFIRAVPIARGAGRPRLGEKREWTLKKLTEHFRISLATIYAIRKGRQRDQLPSHPKSAEQLQREILEYEAFLQKVKCRDRRRRAEAALRVRRWMLKHVLAGDRQPLLPTTDSTDTLSD